MRARDALLALLGFAVVAIGLAAGWSWLSATTSRAAMSEDPLATITAYLDAWEAGDHGAMAELVREVPDDFAARHTQLREGLAAQSLELLPGTPVEEVDGRIAVPVTVRVGVDYHLEPLTWDTRVVTVRERGEWSILFSLATIHPELREAWRFDLEREEVDRAPILASDGTQLAGPGETITFGFEPSGVSDPERMIEAFERAVPGSGRVAEREIGRDNLVDGWFYPVASVPHARSQPVWDRLRGVPGVLRMSEGDRVLYDAGFAQHVVGIIAEATAEQLEQRRAEGLDADAGLRIPQFGLERAMDDHLTGSELVRVGLREGDDGPLRIVIAEAQLDPSAPVRTTIDVTVQQAVEDALTDVDLPAGMVVIDTSDGAILASASRPLASYNRAFAGRFPPGSTFKIVTTAAIVAAGGSLDDEVACPAETIVGGLRVPNAGGFDLGTVPLIDAFAASCNTSFATLGAGIGAEDLAEAAEWFGFGIDPQLPLTAFGGSFPAPADVAETGAAAFGQGRVEASVLHMASVAGAAATGTWHQPYLLAANGPGESRNLPASTTDALRRAMRAVVTDGTGTTADVAGLEVLGKTGTAQASGESHAWFVGVWEGYAFAVLVEDGGAGGQVAGPIAARFVSRLAALTGELDPSLLEDTEDDLEPAEGDVGDPPPDDLLADLEDAEGDGSEDPDTDDDSPGANG